MPADKDAAKRRRQARNRQERQNRQARTEGAKRTGTRPSRTATETPTKTNKGSKGASTTSLAKTPARTPGAAGGVFGKLFPPRPEPAKGGTDGRPARAARPPSEVVEVEGAGARGLLLRLTAQPGGRAVVLALVVAVVCAVTLFLVPVSPPAVFDGYGVTVVRAQAEAGGEDRAGVDAAEDDFGDREMVFAQDRAKLLDLVPLSNALIFALAPMLLAGTAVRSLLRPTRSRTLLLCSIGGVLYVVLTGPIGIFFLLGVVALGFGAYQSSKADKLALAASA